MRLEICCEDRVGIVQEVLNILVEYQISLRKIEVLPDRQRMYVAFPEVEFEQLQRVMPQIRKINGIGDVRTISFIPAEREHNELKTLLRALPDGILSLDTQGKVLIANQSALSSLGCVSDEVIGQSINQFLNGFDFIDWLEQDEIAAQTIKVSCRDEEFIADILPVYLSGEALDEANGETLLGVVINLKSASRLGQQVGAFREYNSPSFNGFIGKSPALKKVLREAQKMAQLDAPMLMTGETGTGKETLARACHEASRGADAPFVAINCASIPDDDAEVELFGREASTSDESDHQGLLEQAHGGTLFFDEVGDMSPNLQAKLVRFLHDGAYRRVGCETEMQTDVRVICSSQKDLYELMEKGEFRQDLFYRLNVLTIIIPPLRERKQDIMLLVQHFIHQFARQLGCIVPGIEPKCEEMINQYPWPGNTRQLENALYRAVTLLEGDKITLQHLQLPSQHKVRISEQEFTGTLEDAVKQYEGDILRELFPSYPSSRQLAKRLGLSHTAVANKLRDYGINKNTMKT
ncbi:MAG: transcriptional regulator of aroF, aroG, tyrA and aromatic amino acid transport [Phenylobacterium sp.]|jgi:transcriptional regulator of aroF, aroG, tyrA and aromatic amino acid transport